MNAPKLDGTADTGRWQQSTRREWLLDNARLIVLLGVLAVEISWVVLQ
ncbi:TPA: hypothetical protein ACOFDH_000469 [Stenotrophomonas maltophilia]